MPSQTFSHATVAAAPVETVWATFDNPDTWESIGGIDRVFDARTGPSGRLDGFSFDTEVAGRKYVGTATLGERVDGRVIVWNVRNSEIKGLIRVELGNAEEGTSVAVTLEVASASFMSSMFFPVIANTIGSGLPEAVENFAKGFSQV